MILKGYADVEKHVFYMKYTPNCKKFLSLAQDPVRPHIYAAMNKKYHTLGKC